MQKLIKKLEKIVLAILCGATLFWIMMAFQNPTMFFPTKERTVVLNDPKLRFGKYDLFLTDRHGAEPTKEYRMKCLLKSNGSKSFCDAYGYHISLVKAYKIESILLYTSFLNTNDLIVTGITFHDPYDGKTKVIKLSEQEIADWRYFYTKKQKEQQILCITTILCWGVYVFYLLLKRRYKRIKAVDN